MPAVSHLRHQVTSTAFSEVNPFTHPVQKCPSEYCMLHCAANLNTPVTICSYEVILSDFLFPAYNDSDTH